MFWIDNRLSALATGHGIRGDGKGVLGRGIWGHSDSDGIGVAGDGGIGVLAVGTRAALQVGDTGTAPPTRTDAHVKGELTTDVNGDLWFCVADGTPGTWRQLSGADTSGQLHLLAAPVRASTTRARAARTTARWRAAPAGTCRWRAPRRSRRCRPAPPARW